MPTLRMYTDFEGGRRCTCVVLEITKIPSQVFGNFEWRIAFVKSGMRHAPGAKIHVEGFCRCLYGYNKGLHAPYMVGLATYMFCSTHMRHEK